MSEAFLFGLFERVRERIIHQVENVPESHRNLVPNGFNNSLHWQLGHIITISDGVILGYGGVESKIPTSYAPLFRNGTKPADWQKEPPHWDVLILQLREQFQVLQETLHGKLSEPVAVKDNFAKAETIGDLVQLNMTHENLHLGMITAMVKVLNLNNQ
ncbi:putative damage-inducible protein DinB [Paenibacillus sp. DS2015]|uniref:DinB family protein n=1 Tax=Paenibacillus sp. DS2015 TaxID=3373917 RepID=UPI003D1EA797